MHRKLNNKVKVEHASSWSSVEHETMIKFASALNKSRSCHQDVDA